MPLPPVAVVVPAELGAFGLVGDCRTSESRGGGSLRKGMLSQMLVPHENGLLPALVDAVAFQPSEGPLKAEFGLGGQALWSAAVIGIALEEFAVVVREGLRASDGGTSLSHEVRRAGRVVGAEVEMEADAADVLTALGPCTAWLEWCSVSSSDEARASESGVDRPTPRRAFSSRIE